MLDSMLRKDRFFVLLAGCLLAVTSLQLYAGAWYKGDLHAHSIHSDGNLEVIEIIRMVEEIGLDFFVLTDHDSKMGGVPRHFVDPDYFSEKTILLYGVEWTSKKGHANIFHTRPFPYARLWKTNRSLNAEMAISEAHRHHALFSLNHPARRFGKWRYGLLEGVDLIEVWNNPERHNRNSRAIKDFWDPYLKMGIKVTGVGGSDIHFYSGPLFKVVRPGSPTTWAYAEKRSGKSILEAIKSGKVSISYSPYSERLELYADTNGDGQFNAMSGDEVKAHNETVTFKLKIAKGHDFYSGKRLKEIKVVKNGREIKTIMIKKGQNQYFFRDKIGGEGKVYYRAELIGRHFPGHTPHVFFYGKIISLTNPIYFGNGW